MHRPMLISQPAWQLLLVNSSSHDLQYLLLASKHSFKRDQVGATTLLLDDLLRRVILLLGELIFFKLRPPL